jgi:hypothetical protein
MQTAKLFKEECIVAPPSRRLAWGRPRSTREDKRPSRQPRGWRYKMSTTEFPSTLAIYFPAEYNAHIP